MTYEDFLEKLDENKISYEMDLVPNRDNRWNTKVRKYIPGTEKISVQWEIGGVSGGSCWDWSDPQPYTTREIEPEFTDFDTTLSLFCPNISFLQYKVLAGKLIENGEYTDYEYYGNHTDYKTKTVKLRKLFEYLVQNGII